MCAKPRVMWGLVQVRGLTVCRKTRRQRFVMTYIKTQTGLKKQAAALLFLEMTSWLRPAFVVLS